jgi:hypothetical protein
MEIKPDIIAVTENDPHIEKKKAQAKQIGGELKVVPSIKNAFHLKTGQDSRSKLRVKISSISNRVIGSLFHVS